MRSTKTIVVLLVAFSLFLGAFAQAKKEVVCGPVNPLIACATIGDEACATFKDGSQRDILANTCTCQNSDIVKYTYGKCSLQSSTPSKFTPEKCRRLPGVQLRCSTIATPGCAKYNNGTYVYLQNTNNCIICQNDDVFSFNAGEKCPVLSTPTTPSNPNKVVCPATTPFILICPATGKDACATFKDGSKKNILANACTCKNKDIVDYTLGKCPLSNPNPPNKQCNHAGAYQCPATPSTFCPLYYVEQSCVCYKDGTCKTVKGGNSCSICGNKNAVSVTEGKTCPTTCSLSSGDKLQAAKAKVAAALKKLQEAQANVKKYQKEYNTAVAELNALQKKN